jgi:hypothetical protein
MVTLSGVVDEVFGSREITTLYALAMFTQVNEIDNDRHLKMYFDEFLEALCRVAQKTAIQSPYAQVYLCFLNYFRTPWIRNL